MENLNPDFFDFFNTAVLIGFDFLLLALAIPIFLQYGRRLFDLMIYCAIAPLAFSAFVFDDYRYLFTRWWNNIKSLAISPLVYAIFICFLGLFIFGTKNVVSGPAIFLKMIVIIGGLSRMANPPDFVKKHLDNGPTTDESIWSVLDSYKKAYKTVTLQDVRSAKFIKEKVSGRPSKTKELRKKHGRRYLKDLKKD